MRLVNHGIAHIKNNSVSHIDLCIVDANDTIADYSESDGPFFHHHFLIEIWIRLILNPFIIVFPLLIGAMSPITNMSNVNDMLVEIVTNIQTTLNIHAPLININSKRKFEPWITNEIFDN